MYDPHRGRGGGRSPGGRWGGGRQHPMSAPGFHPQQRPAPEAYYHGYHQEQQQQYSESYDYEPLPAPHQQQHRPQAPPRRSPRGGGGRSGTPPWRRRSFDLDDHFAASSAGAVSFSDELAGQPRGGSMEVRNDYSQQFLETGERPQNFIRDATVDEGFAEYPKLARLLAAKDAMVDSRRTPAMHVQADLRALDLRSLGTKFDVIYIDPPWEEYARRAAPFVVASQGGGGGCDGSQDLDASIWRYEELEALPIEDIADTPSFIFLWCGSGGRVTEDVEHGPLHVDEGRCLLKKWGYRRCEEVCWIKTNKEGPHKQPDLPTSTTSLLVRTKEHCLMGIKGSVRRNRDGHILHCNVHTDIVIAEQPTDPLSLRKPEEMYRIMEHFAMGRRRLELFGCPHNVRPGWVTVGNQLHGTTYNKEQYLAWMREPGINPDGTPCPGHLLGSTPLIEELRPKTPPREAAAATAAAIGAMGPRAAALTGAPTSPPVSPRGPAHRVPPTIAVPVAQAAARGPFQSPRPGSIAPLRGRGGRDSGGIDTSAWQYGGQGQQQQYQGHFGPYQQGGYAEWATEEQTEAAYHNYSGGGGGGQASWGQGDWMGQEGTGARRGSWDDTYYQHGGGY